MRRAVRATSCMLRPPRLRCCSNPGTNEGVQPGTPPGPILPICGRVHHSCLARPSAPLPCMAGYLPADGRLLPIAQYTAVFALMGTTYGASPSTVLACTHLAQLSVPVGELWQLAEIRAPAGGCSCTPAHSYMHHAQVVHSWWRLGCPCCVPSSCLWPPHALLLPQVVTASITLQFQPSSPTASLPASA